MKKYKVITECTWANGYWDKDRIVEFEDNLKPPEHFQLVDRHGDPVEIVEDGFKPTPATMSEINKERSANAPKTGMAFGKSSKNQETI